MSRRLLCVVAMVALAPAVASAQVAYVRAGRLVDPQAGKVLTDQILRIEGERIVSVGPWKGAPKDGLVIDWSGLTILPGLIDMHTHLVDDEQSENIALPLLRTAAQQAYIGAGQARATLMGASPAYAMSEPGARSETPLFATRSMKGWSLAPACLWLAPISPRRAAAGRSPGSRRM